VTGLLETAGVSGRRGVFPGVANALAGRTPA
jgi:hypothetical protein